MLPFKRNEAAVVGPVEHVQRASDKPEEMEVIDLIAEHLLKAIQKSDRKALADGLEAFMYHMRQVDEEQDQEMEESQGEGV